MKQISRAIFFLILCAAPMVAKAQIQVDLKLDRDIYIAHEPIGGKLTIINRAGRDLIFGNTGGNKWLDFSVTDTRGHLISPMRAAKNPRPVVIASGQTHEMRVIVNDIYPMGVLGTYRIRASVAFPQINRVFQTKLHTVRIAEAKPYWNQIVGVPPGYPGAGTYRIYELMTYFHGARQKALYFRVKNNSDGRVLRTFSLGDYLNVRPPQHAIDKSNQLHLIHMTAPQQYYYTVIDLDGEVLTRERYFEKKGNRPHLVTTSSGEIHMRGGISEKDAKTPYEKREFRRLSERPPGMPRL